MRAIPITDPLLLRQWHHSKNGSLTPDLATPGSHKKVWWRCEKGHEWQAEIKSRTLLESGCPYCAGKVTVPGENDLATLRPDLATQWHVGKNGRLTPRDVRPGSHKKVWWRCSKGHEWQAIVASRANGEGCPVCAGRVVISGENDLASQFPEIAAQWDREHNGALTAETVSPYSSRKVWWRCRHGHHWQAAISARTCRGTGCPYCAGRLVLAGFNDLAFLDPKVARQWHPTLNAPLTPEQVTAGSRRQVWWQCAEGHVWKARIHSRTGKQKCGCPVCAGRVKGSRKYRCESTWADQRANDGASRV